MRRISYDGASFLTTDTVSDALLPLFVALGTTDITQTLEIPAVNAQGQTVIVKLVADPSTELISVPEDSLWDEPDTTTAVAYLLALTQAVLSATPSSSPSDTIAITDFDWYDTGTP